MRVYQGQSFGRWTVEDYDPPTQHRYVRVRCTCGVVKRIFVYSLTRGLSTSCGCWRKEKVSSVQRQHGESHKATAEYTRWVSMWQRCRTKTHKSFPNYGARGITVCLRWASYEKFLQDMGRCPPKTTLERRDNNKGYSPENCYWAPRSVQARNKRNNRWITYKGTTLVLKDWAKRLGMHSTTLLARIQRGWPLKEVLNSTRHHKPHALKPSPK